jgi:hypothetical protein
VSSFRYTTEGSFTEGSFRKNISGNTTKYCSTVVESRIMLNVIIDRQQSVDRLLESLRVCSSLSNIMFHWWCRLWVRSSADMRHSKGEDIIWTLVRLARTYASREGDMSW